MPTIPSMSLTDPVSPSEIYTNGLFDPNAIPDTLEIMNGGLDYDNFGSPDKSITPRMWQYGSFAYGYSSGFERTESTFARQASKELSSNDVERVTHATLSQKLFFPFSPKCLIWGYQAFFQQDATAWGMSASPQRENWTVRAAIDGVPQTQATVILPLSRWSVQASSYDTGAIVHTGTTKVTTNSYENRWRFASKSMTATSVAKGYHEFKVTIESDIREPDLLKAKCKSVTGYFFALAIR
tara:strand:- start:21033 stop:21752 length:720 start_codon:yes stop_codon:yes gene_type:complete